MNSIVQLGVITFFASMLFLSCGKKSVENESEKGISEGVSHKTDVKNPNQEEEGIEGESQEGTTETSEVTSTPEDDLPPGVTLTPETPPVNQLDAPQPPEHTSLRLNNDVEIIFFSEKAWFSDDAVVLSQNIGDGMTLLWFVENEISGHNTGNNLSKYVHRLVERLARNDTDSIKDLVCGAEGSFAQRTVFLRQAIHVGVPVLIKNNIINQNFFGTIKDYSEFRGYRVSSVGFEDDILTHFTIVSSSKSKTFKRVNAPEDATKLEFKSNVHFNGVNLENYYNFLTNFWDNGKLSSCNIRTT